VGGTVAKDRLHALQKYAGGFNHRVVALVADNLQRQWLRETNWIR